MSVFGDVRRRTTAVVVACALGVGLSGCGVVYLEHGPTVAPKADAAERHRQDMATQAAGIASKAAPCAVVKDEATALSAAAAAIVKHADDHAAAWGGVWVPFPGQEGTAAGSPSPSATPTSTGTSSADTATLSSPAAPTGKPATSSNPTGTASGAATAPALPKGCDVAGLAAALQAGADQAKDLALDPDVEALVPTYASMAVSRYIDLNQLARASQEAGEIKVPAKASPALDLVTAGATAPKEQVTAVILAEDSAGYGDEFAAARLEGTPAQRIATAAVEHRSQAGAMVAAWDTDPRSALYDVPTDTATDKLVAFAASLEAKLGDAYADVLASTTGDQGAVTTLRGQALGAMVTQFDRARSWGYDITSFPGSVPGAVSTSAQ